MLVSTSRFVVSGASESPERRNATISPVEIFIFMVMNPSRPSAGVNSSIGPVSWLVNSGLPFSSTPD